MRAFSMPIRMVDLGVHFKADLIFSSKLASSWGHSTGYLSESIHVNFQFTDFVRPLARTPCSSDVSSMAWIRLISIR